MGMILDKDNNVDIEIHHLSQLSRRDSVGGTALHFEHQTAPLSSTREMVPAGILQTLIQVNG